MASALLIILEDHPAIAPESPGALYDATEIDEILALRTAALTDEEKREARGTDDRAAAVIDLADTMPPEVLERLHGAVRSLREVTGTRTGTASAPAADGFPDEFGGAAYPTPRGGTRRAMPVSTGAGPHRRRRPVAGRGKQGAAAARAAPHRRTGPVPGGPVRRRSRPCCTTWTAGCTWP